MVHLVESVYEGRIEPGMVVLGADTALVGEVASSGLEAMVIARRPLPAMTLPLSLVDAVVDGVVVLRIPADAADELGESTAELRDAGIAAF